MNTVDKAELEAVIWDYYSPRQLHAWNMLVRAWDDLESLEPNPTLGFEIEYRWENFILRLWLYRGAIKTLTKLSSVSEKAYKAISCFDQKFDHEGRNDLKAIRDMIEHFDDYAAGRGRGPAQRHGDLDPFRHFTNDEYKRGQFSFERRPCMEAALALRDEAQSLSDEFISWYKAR